MGTQRIQISPAIEIALLELVQTAKSSAEFFWPTYINEWMDDLQVGSVWVYSVPIFQHGFNNLRVEMRVVSKTHIECIFDHPNGTRLGIIHLRKEIAGVKNDNSNSEDS